MELILSCHPSFAEQHLPEHSKFRVRNDVTPKLIDVGKSEKQDRVVSIVYQYQPIT